MRTAACFVTCKVTTKIRFVRIEVGQQVTPSGRYARVLILDISAIATSRRHIE